MRRLSASNPPILPPTTVHHRQFDVASLSLLTLLLLLSLLSLLSILRLRLKSRRSHHLRSFNSLWHLRLLLVAFVSLWSFDALLHLPLVYKSYLSPSPFFFLLFPNLDNHSSFCKLHIVLSLGLYEPGFLITLLFIIHVSIKQCDDIYNNIYRQATTFVTIFLTLLPFLIIQALLLFSSPLQGIDFFRKLSTDQALSCACIFPIYSTTVFAGFAIGYCVAFFITYWKVISLVINKRTRMRIDVLAFSVLVCLPVQVASLAASAFWECKDIAHELVLVGMVVAVAICGAVGEGVLVIKPIADAISAGGDGVRGGAAEVELGEGTER